jgi:hypothetical protein
MPALVHTPRPQAPSPTARHSRRRGGSWLRLTAGCLLGASLWPAIGVAQTPAPMDLRAARAIAATAQVPRTPLTPAQQHEQQLQAIREALLEATLEKPTTQVISSAWVDDKGTLHENTHYHSQAQVRGVRVLSYLPQDAEAPRAQVNLDVLPWGLHPSRAAQAASGSCEGPPRAWRLPMQLQTRLDGGFTGAQRNAGLQIMQMAGQSWAQQLGQSQRWQGQDTERPQANSYYRALTSMGEDMGGWVAELVISPQASLADQKSMLRQVRQTVQDTLPWTAPVWRWSLSLNVGMRPTPDAAVVPVWQAQQTLTIPVTDTGRHPAAGLQQILNSVEEQMTTWVRDLDARSQCEPVQFVVQRNATQALTLAAGQGSGLRPGDRVLLMNPSHVPSRLLEAGATQHLALAEVVKVGRRQTQLQQLAGPVLPAHGQWVALPL